MRVLVVNKFWYRRGGLERVMFDEIEWLAQAGHEVAHFSTRHPQNEPSPWAAYFVEYLELGESGGLSSLDKARAAGRMFHNGMAARQFARLLADFNPDVVHVHGMHRQISPSILGVARRAGVPVVQTLHDYHHICPADTLLHRGRRVCQPRRCGRLWTAPAVFGACVRGSVAASALSACETAWARRFYERGIDRFICPSVFMAEQIAAAGWNVPVEYVPNAAPPVLARTGPGCGFVVAGRVSSEKGIEQALEAARLAGAHLSVVGTGPLLGGLKTAFPEALFTGHLDCAGVESAIRRARAVVVPSLWFENASMSVLEALSAGVPVIGTRLGGTPELVADGVEGMLVSPGDVSALAAAMRRIQVDEGLSLRMGEAAKERAATAFSPSRHVAGILRVYESAVSDRQRGL
jgi:glycosyltransferase involved in cell wall biosynthesis